MMPSPASGVQSDLFYGRINKGKGLTLLVYLKHFSLLVAQYLDTTGPLSSEFILYLIFPTDAYWSSIRGPALCCENEQRLNFFKF